jgi:cellulose synthase/poly-beta-1,6-N-acetylglucosamine synthase-like glycosyltransferase
MQNPKVSICIPYHQTDKTALFLARLLKSIDEQTFTDYEIILTCDGLFAENHNSAIKKAKGEIIKIIQMDDCFAHPDALKNIVEDFDDLQSYEWMISPTIHTDGSKHEPKWTDDIYAGNNRLGSVSSIAFRKRSMLLFEEPLCWLVDCDWYYRMFIKHGHPILGKDFGVVVDVRTDRLTHTIPDYIKMEEVYYLTQKYGK